MKGKLTQNKVHLQDHEYITVKLFLDMGYDVELIPKSQIAKYRQPDIMLGGVAWEIKAPIGTGRKNIENVMQGAAEQSRNIIIDLFRSKMTEEDAIKGYEQRFKCTIQINGTPVPHERYKRFAPTVRYPFLRLFIGSKFLMFFPFISKRYDSLRTRARLASA